MTGKHAPLAPGSTVGILGGGQLGRMLALAAARLGLKCHIFCPDPDSPAFDVARRVTIAEYTDEDALDQFAKQCDIITYEFENIPAPTAAFLIARRPVFPSVSVLETTQDRLTEKQFVESLGIPVAPFRDVLSLKDIHKAVDELGFPGVLKSRRFGYDGKAQYVIRSRSDIEQAWPAVGEVPSIFEAFVNFDFEASIIAIRSHSGEFVAYDPPKNTHKDQILKTSQVPSGLTTQDRIKAFEIAKNIANGLAYVGTIGIELFVMPEEDGKRELIVNEIAPRVHNSGHWTQDACITDQFEQHIRAIAGWPLGDVSRHSDVLMTNLIGNDVDEWLTLADEKNVNLHLYGKAYTRAGRKMGHINRLSPLSDKNR